MTKKTRVGFRDWLSSELGVLLEVPHAEAQRIITHIFETIANALQQGEEVRVKGFGRFVHHYQKPTNRYALFYNTSIPRKARMVIKFKPDPELLYLVNDLYTGPHIVWPPPPFRNIRRKRK